MPAWLGPLLQAAGTIAGFSSDQSARSEGRRASEREYLRQKEFAQNSILWRAQDAERAGIHPLFALGAMGSGYSPAVAIDGGGRGAEALSALGQDLSRAHMANMDARTRAKEVAAAQMAAAHERRKSDILFGLEVERSKLENMMLSSQLARFNSAQLGPGGQIGTSMGGGTESGPRVQPLPAQPVISSRSDSAREAGNITDMAYARTPQGGLSVVPSQDVKNRIEDSPMEWLWFWRNNVVPNIGRYPTPSVRDFPLPAGQVWRWNFQQQQFLPYNPRTNTWFVRRGEGIPGVQR